MDKSRKYKSIAIKLLYGYAIFWLLFCIVSSINLNRSGADSPVFVIISILFLAILSAIILTKKRHYDLAKFILIIVPPYVITSLSIYAKFHGILDNVFFYILPRIFIIFTLMSPIIFFGVKMRKKLIIGILAILPPILGFEWLHSFFGIDLKNIPYEYSYYFKFIVFLSLVYTVPLVSLIFYQIVNLQFKNKIEEKSKILLQEKEKIVSLNERLASNANLFRIYEITSRNISLNDIVQEVLDELLSLHSTIMQHKGSILLRDIQGHYEIVAHRNCDNIPQINKIVSGASCTCDQMKKVTEFNDNNRKSQWVCEQDEYDILPHGHYIVPITNGIIELGLMNIYINDGQLEDEETIVFLEKVADILARKIISNQRINLLAQKNHEIKIQGERLKSTHNELTESVSYAKLLQNSLLPNVKTMSRCLGDISVLFLPKDQIGGDLYVTHHIDQHIYFGIGDCTGHGIPGALLAAMSIEAIKSVMNIYAGQKPNYILEKLRKIAKNRFNSSSQKGSRTDAMDAGLCMFDKEKNLLHFAGGFINLIVIRDNELIEFQAERCPVGVYPDEKTFTLHSIPLQKNDVIYLASDGYADQFGYNPSSAKFSKFKRRRFKKLIKSISNLSCQEQTEILKKNIIAWKSGEEQIDDITVMVVKPIADTKWKKNFHNQSPKMSWD